jgi:asparagine synthase (glutamine-hydrolysing)
MRVDKMSMGVSLEGRVPFLDHKLVELAMSIPESVKTRNGNLKHILKKSVRGLIPDELIDRKKQGFGVPIHEWFLDRLGQQTQNELKSFCDETNYIEFPQVQRLFKQKQSPLIWYLFNLALWWKKHFN